MHEEVTAITVQNYETIVGGFIKEFQLSCHFLREVLDLAYHVLGIHPVLLLVLWKLTVHLTYHILCRLGILKGLSRDENGRFNIIIL
jgi:hypothetical protein